MQTTDRATFQTLLGDVMAFYRQDTSTFALSVWWQACQNFDLEQVRKALTAHAMDPERGQFAPKPADIVRKLQGTATDRSLIGWGKVLDAMQRVGAYQSVVFDDPAVHASISDMGGWPAVCRSAVDELPFLQKRFTDLHKSYTARGVFEYPARLVGESEATNGLHGHKSAPPMLIGDPAKAQQVAQLGGSGSKTQITLASDAVPGVARIGNAA